MKILHLHIHQFRNLHNIHIQPNICNVFLGQNGSGKTSILESIYLLSRGKSFRHHQPKHYIQHGCSQTTVFAKLNDDEKVAIQKQIDASTQLRLNGQNLTTQSPLAQLLPTLLLEPMSLSGLENGSQTRRELFDWLLFHVERSFHTHWVRYQKLLKQRNALLKQVGNIDSLTVWQHQEMMAWDKELSSHALAIHQLRETVLSNWQPYFYQQIQTFLPHYADEMRLRYAVGFDTQMDLITLFANRLSADLELGYTRIGSHRADLNVVLDKISTDEMGQKLKQTLVATDMLSRGEKKLLMMALRLSQLPLLNQAHKIPLVLLDDITAELDDKALLLLLQALKQVNSQLFITSLSADVVPLIEQIWQDDCQVFHVEHGKITTYNG